MRSQHESYPPLPPIRLLLLGEKDAAHHGYAPSSMTGGCGSIDSHCVDENPKAFGLLHQDFQFRSSAYDHADSMKKKLERSRHSGKISKKPADARLARKSSLAARVSNRPHFDSSGRCTNTSMHSNLPHRGTPFPDRLSCRGSPSPEPLTYALSGFFSHSCASTPASAGASSASAVGPRGLSPNAPSPTSTQSPSTSTMTVGPYPRTLPEQTLPRGRDLSRSSPRKVAEVQPPDEAKIQGLYTCTCCPKKPKKFETTDGLQLHEAEKQYTCNYCDNRFKNKNEVERHQNSLHIRRSSWSCSAFSDCSKAFLDSLNRPGEADTCGYCGQDFPRSGLGPGNGTLSRGRISRHATEKDVKERSQHLKREHMFGECKAKKFYRADHLKQHFSHAHQALPGDWNNKLVDRCKLEEEPLVSASTTEVGLTLPSAKSCVQKAFPHFHPLLG